MHSLLCPAGQTDLAERTRYLPHILTQSIQKTIRQSQKTAKLYYVEGQKLTMRPQQGLIRKKSAILFVLEPGDPDMKANCTPFVR